MSTWIQYSMKSGNEYVQILPHDRNLLESELRAMGTKGGFLGGTSAFSSEDSAGDFLMLRAEDIEAVRIEDYPDEEDA